MTVYIIAIVVLVMFSAYFSATETAFSSLNKTRLKTMVDKGSKAAKLAYDLGEQYDKLISSILIGNNVVNIAAASIGTLLFVKLCGPNSGATVSTVVLTIVVLIFGEITPKSIAKDCPEKFAMFSAPFMKALMVILTPLTFLFSAWKKMVSKLLRLETSDKMTQEELLTLVDEVQESGSIDEEEGELLHNAIEFSECTAQDILTHRVDLEAVPTTATKEEIATRFTESRYSRLLLYKDSIDNIIGVIHQKDFYHGTGVTSKSMREIMSPVVFVPLEASISDILHQMQEKKVHVAVVIDEYGGTGGIVTMEDILEELVGEIWDEHDEVAELFTQITENTYRVAASVQPEEFFEFFEIEAEEEIEAATLNSWIVKKLNKLPRRGDQFDFNRLTVKITDTGRHRVSFIEVKVNEKAADPEEEPATV